MVLGSIPRQGLFHKLSLKLLLNFRAPSFFGVGEVIHFLALQAKAVMG